MKKFATIIGISLIALGASSCHKKAIRGEGSNVSETRNVSKFTRIDASGSHDITVVKDDKYYVIVTGYSNLLPHYETYVSNDRLVLEMDDKFWNVRNDNIRVEVHTPYVDDVDMNGSGSMIVHSGFEQDNFHAEINGSGDITVSNNVYKKTSAKVNGSGTCNMETCEAEHVTTDISGSGDIYVKVSEYLKVRISGSGNVYYRGTPQSIDTEISGSGKVQKRN